MSKGAVPFLLRFALLSLFEKGTYILCFARNRLSLVAPFTLLQSIVTTRLGSAAVIAGSAGNFVKVSVVNAAVVLAWPVRFKLLVPIASQT